MVWTIHVNAYSGEAEVVATRPRWAMCRFSRASSKGGEKDEAKTIGHEQSRE